MTSPVSRFSSATGSDPLFEGPSIGDAFAKRVCRCSSSRYGLEPGSIESGRRGDCRQASASTVTLSAAPVPCGLLASEYLRALPAGRPAWALGWQQDPECCQPELRRVIALGRRRVPASAA